jgi:hypothetical protein
MAVRRGRPQGNSIRFDFTLRLDPDLDGDLLAWLQNLPKRERVKALKRALRSGGVNLSADESNDVDALDAAESILGAWDF